MTISNVLLIWCKSLYCSRTSAEFYRDSDTSNAAASHRASESQLSNEVKESPLDASELDITPELKAAFISSLKDYGIHLRFFSGSWESFDLHAAGGKYDMIITSETVYRTDSLQPLVHLMQTTLLQDEKTPATRSSLPRCLVAAKMVYFGVGGGISEFVEAVSNSGGKVESVWETRVGVSRRIMKVDW